MSFNNAREILTECVKRGIRLYVNGTELKARSPKGTMTPDLRARIAEAKPYLITLLQGETSSAAPTPAQIPLSFSQERLWFLDRFDGADKAFTMPMGFILSGPLNITAMRQATDKLVERHQALRTTIKDTEDGPRQEITPFSFGVLEEWDLCASDNPEQTFTDKARSASDVPFDLSEGPLFRLILARLGEDHHGLLMLMHHIISDRASMFILKRDLTRLYTGLSLDEPVQLPTPTQFGEYAKWQREYIEAGHLDNALQDAMDDLSGAPELLELPWDHPRPAVQSMYGATHTFPVPPDLAKEVAQLGRRAAASPYMVWLSLFGLLLSRLSGQDDLTLGCPASTRRSDDEDCVGFFINTVPLRLQTAGDPTFMNFLTQVRDMARRSFSRQELPFEQLVDRLQPNRSLDRNPLFQAMFVLQHEPSQSAQSFHGLTEKIIPWDASVSEFDLNLTMEPKGDGYDCYLEYSSELFDAPTMKQWSNWLLEIARQAVQTPDARVNDLPLLPATEQETLVTVWSGAQTAGPDAPLLPTQLHDKCLAHGHKTAIRTRDGVTSYEELSRLASGVAHWLKERDITKGSTVAVVGPMGPEWIAGCVGLMHSGCVFLPLDPALPEQRLQTIFDDADIAAILCTEAILPMVPSSLPHLLFTDIEPRDLTAPIDFTPDDLANMIYTSGSTGTPKGVRVSHGSLAFHCANVSRIFDLDESTNGLQFASPGFDVVLEEIWPLLACGGSVTICPPDVREQLEHFDAFIREHDVHLANLPAPFWEAWTEYLQTSGNQAPNRLRLLVTGSDRVSPQWFEKWESIAPECRFLSGYGPTEATITATFYDPTKDGLWPDAPCLPLGRPMPGVRTYVLDEQLRPVPPGCVGELCLAGPGIAMGYHNRPESTAHVFVDSPVIDGERLYRTGDKVRFMPGPGGLGTLHFIGRTDHQIKRRGFRIEPGEIESVLLRHPNVEQAVVVSIPHGLIALARSSESDDALLQHLTKELPSHMVPDGVLIVDELPMLPGGKLDRTAAARMAETLYIPKDDDFEPSRPGAESILAEIWQDILNVQSISRNANFFKLGGDSIRSLRVTGQARQHGLLITPRQIFQGQTLAEIARLASTIKKEANFSGPVEGTVRPTPILAWLLQQPPDTIAAFSMPMPLNLSHPVGEQNLLTALEILFKHHPMLRLRIQNATNAPRLNIASEDEATQLAAKAIFTGERIHFDLENGPLFLAQQTGPDSLFLVAHHACVDAVSWSVIMEDLDTILTALESEKSPDLPASAMPFPVFAERLHEKAQRPALKDRLSLWQRECADTQPLCPVPAEEDSGPVEGTLELRAHGKVTEETVLAAVIRAMDSIRTPKAWLMDMESHGRDATDGDLSRTVGWFTSVTPTRVDTTSFPADSPAQAARLAARQALQAARSQGAEHGLLRYLCPDETVRTDMAALPTAPVLFNYLGSIMNGQDDSRLTPAHDRLEEAAELPRIAPSHGLELNTFVIDNTMRLNWVRDPKHIPDDFMQSLLAALPQAFMEVSDTTQNITVPSDFPVAWRTGLNWSGLRRIQRDYDKAGVFLKDVCPLTPLQHGMLFHTLLGHGAGEYFDQFVCQVELNAPATPNHLRRAWEQVTARHTALHSSVHWQGLDEPMLAVASNWKLEWNELDWRGQDQESALNALLKEDRARPFVLNRPPLQRLTLCRTGESTYTLLWSDHHIIMDGWSVPIVLGEVLKTANGLANGQQPDLPPAPSFQIIAAWKQEQDKETARDFWRTELSNFDTPTPLPLADIWTDKNGPQDATSPHSHVVFTPDEDAEIQTAMRTHGWTLNSLMQGAWGLLLSRYDGGRDVCFGLTASGRPAHLPEVERMVGCCIETVPVRVQVNGKTNASEWLDDLRNRQPDREAHAHLGIDAITRLSALPRNVALFDSLVLVQTYPVESIHTDASIRFTDFTSNERSNYGLTLVATPSSPETNTGMHLGLFYDHKRFDKEKADQILTHVRTLLLELVRHPDAELDGLEMLTIEELHRINQIWNGHKKTYRFSGPMQEIFEDHAHHSPDALAMEYFGHEGDTPVQTMTYGELDRRANQLAHALQANGVRSGTFVGLCLPRGSELLVGMLGSLKAGGAYVPLDPDYPKDRLIHMLEDSKPPVTVTMESLLDYLPLKGRTIDLCLDRDAELLETQPTEQPPCGASSDDAAFLIYTSGSTGMPKGVKTLHRGMTNLVQMQTEHFQVTPHSRVMQFFSPSFDASTWEIVMALCSGGTVIMADKDDRMPGHPLYDLMERARVTHITLTPSSLAAVPAPGPDGLPHLECLITGGEGCDHSLAARWGDTRRYYHGYGPTETTICCSAPHYTDFSGPMSLGKAHPNMRMHVLDDRLRPCPVGAVGEICIGGIGVTGGYLNRPNLTATRFWPDPFASIKEKEHGVLFYRSGDQGRWRPDGDIEFAGRVDHQVKVRGFRVELNEITAALLSHPDVAEAAVNAIDGPTGTKVLAAWLVVEPSRDTPDPIAVRDFLRLTLPEHAIPGPMGFIDAIPLTANGKLDRQALPSLLQNDSGRTEFCSEAERNMADVWAEVLNLDHVGPEDNFFDLGGDSIVSIRIVAKAMERGLTITVQDVFNLQTVAALAKASRSATEVVQLDIPDGPVPITPIQHWYFDQPEPLSYYMQSMVLQTPKGMIPKALEMALDGLIEHHAALRTRFVQKEGTWIQEALPPTPAADLLGYEDCRGMDEETFAQTVEEKGIKAKEGTDITTGRVIKPVWFDRGPETPGTLLLAVHHLAVDTVSWRILVSDLTTAYAQACNGETPALPGATTPFAAWAQAITESAQQMNEAEISRWQRIASVDELPIAHEPGQSTTAVSDLRNLTTELTEVETQQLLSGSTTQGATAQEILLASFGQALGRWLRSRGLPSGRTRITMEGHGREPVTPGINTDHTVGWFTAMYPFALNTDETTPGQALQAVRDTLRNMPENKAGYGMLRDLKSDPILKDTPHAAINFNYLGRFDELSGEWGMQPLSSGPELDPTRSMPLLMDVVSLVLDDRMQLEITYPAQVLREDEAQSLVNKWREAVRKQLRPKDAPVQSKHTSVAFLFTGQGSQYPGMTAGLYESEPVYREAVDTLAPVIETETGVDPRIFLRTDLSDSMMPRLTDTAMAQPLLYLVAHGLTALWHSRGIRPAVMLGHSIGELIAAGVGGVFSAEEGARLACLRGRFMSSMEPGGMVAVPLPQSQTSALCKRIANTQLAVINGPEQSVISGPNNAMDELEAYCEANSVHHTRLHTSHAFHSPMMKDAADMFCKELESIQLNAPTIPWASNLTGQWIRQDEATDPAYWAKLILQPVNFEAGLRTVLKESMPLVEIGPASVLSRLALLHPDRGQTLIVASQSRPKSSPDAQVETFGEAITQLQEQS